MRGRAVAAVAVTTAVLTLAPVLDPANKSWAAPPPASATVTPTGTPPAAA